MATTSLGRKITRISLGIGIAGALAVSGLAVAQRVSAGHSGGKAAAVLNAAPGSVVAAQAQVFDIERAAVETAAGLRELPTRDGSFDDLTRYCDPEQMGVYWAKPSGTYLHGAYVSPLGPAPGPDTTKVNGIVACDGATYAFMGFEAVRSGAGWDVVPVPDVGDDGPRTPESAADKVDPHLTPHAAAPKPAVGAVKSVARSKAVPAVAHAVTSAIETFAGYDAQSTCDPTAKPGVLAFRSMVLAAYPNTGSLGITRACSVGGTSEHKEGRAWDWGAAVNSPAQKAEIDRLIAWLFATDQYGNEYAMVRRLGIMYIVWDHRIWGAYRAGEGWRAYNGSNPHTDHVHFSFSWPGARGQTSYWTGIPAVIPGGNSGQHGSGNGGGSNGDLVSFHRNHDTQDPSHESRRHRDNTNGGANTDWYEYWKTHYKDQGQPTDPQQDGTPASYHHHRHDNGTPSPSASPSPSPSPEPSPPPEPPPSPASSPAPAPAPSSTPAAEPSPQPSSGGHHHHGGGGGHRGR